MVTTESFFPELVHDLRTLLKLRCLPLSQALKLATIGDSGVGKTLIRDAFLRAMAKPEADYGRDRRSDLDMMKADASTLMQCLLEGPDAQGTVTEVSLPEDDDTPYRGKSLDYSQHQPKVKKEESSQDGLWKEYHKDDSKDARVLLEHSFVEPFGSNDGSTTRCPAFYREASIFGAVFAYASEEQILREFQDRWKKEDDRDSLLRDVCRLQGLLSPPDVTADAKVRYLKELLESPERKSWIHERIRPWLGRAYIVSGPTEGTMLWDRVAVRRWNHWVQGLPVDPNVEGAKPATSLEELDAGEYGFPVLHPENGLQWGKYLLPALKARCMYVPAFGIPRYACLCDTPGFNDSYASGHSRWGIFDGENPAKNFLLVTKQRVYPSKASKEAVQGLVKENAQVEVTAVWNAEIAPQRVHPEKLQITYEVDLKSCGVEHPQRVGLLAVKAASCILDGKTPQNWDDHSTGVSRLFDVTECFNLEAQGEYLREVKGKCDALLAMINELETEVEGKKLVPRAGDVRADITQKLNELKWCPPEADSPLEGDESGPVPFMRRWHDVSEKVLQDALTKVPQDMSKVCHEVLAFAEQPRADLSETLALVSDLLSQCQNLLMEEFTQWCDQLEHALNGAADIPIKAAVLLRKLGESRKAFMRLLRTEFEVDVPALRQILKEINLPKDDDQSPLEARQLVSSVLQPVLEHGLASLITRPLMKEFWWWSEEPDGESDGDNDSGKPGHPVGEFALKLQAYLTRRLNAYIDGTELDTLKNALQPLIGMVDNLRSTVVRNLPTGDQVASCIKSGKNLSLRLQSLRLHEGANAGAGLERLSEPLTRQRPAPSGEDKGKEEADAPMPIGVESNSFNELHDCVLSLAADARKWGFAGPLNQKLETLQDLEERTAQLVSWFEDREDDIRGLGSYGQKLIAFVRREHARPKRRMLPEIRLRPKAQVPPAVPRWNIKTGAVQTRAGLMPDLEVSGQLKLFSEHGLDITNHGNLIQVLVRATGIRFRESSNKGPVKLYTEFQLLREIAEEAYVAGYEELHHDITRLLDMQEKQGSKDIKDWEVFREVLENPRVLQLFCDVTGVSVMVHHLPTEGEPPQCSVARPSAYQVQYEQFALAFEICALKTGKGRLEFGVAKWNPKPTDEHAQEVDLEPPGIEVSFEPEDAEPMEDSPEVPEPENSAPEGSNENSEAEHEPRPEEIICVRFRDRQELIRGEHVADILLWGKLLLNALSPVQASARSLHVCEFGKRNQFGYRDRVQPGVVYELQLVDYPVLGSVKRCAEGGFEVDRHGWIQALGTDELLNKAMCFSQLAKRLEYADGARWKKVASSGSAHGLLLSRGEDAVVSTRNCVVILDGVSGSNDPTIPNAVQTFVQAIAESIVDVSKVLLFGPLVPNFAVTLLERACERLRNTEYARMETPRSTCTSLVTIGHRLHWYLLGDSRFAVVRYDVSTQKWKVVFMPAATCFCTCNILFASEAAVPICPTCPTNSHHQKTGPEQFGARAFFKGFPALQTSGGYARGGDYGELQDGDLIIAGTDGLWDSLWTQSELWNQQTRSWRPLREVFEDLINNPEGPRGMYFPRFSDPELPKNVGRFLQQRRARTLQTLDHPDHPWYLSDEKVNKSWKPGDPVVDDCSFVVSQVARGQVFEPAENWTDPKSWLDLPQEYAGRPDSWRYVSGIHIRPDNPSFEDPIREFKDAQGQFDDDDDDGDDE